MLLSFQDHGFPSQHMHLFNIPYESHFTRNPPHLSKLRPTLFFFIISSLKFNSLSTPPPRQIKTHIIIIYHASHPQYKPIMRSNILVQAHSPPRPRAPLSSKALVKVWSSPKPNLLLYLFCEFLNITFLAYGYTMDLCSFQDFTTLLWGERNLRGG